MDKNIPICTITPDRDCYGCSVCRNLLEFCTCGIKITPQWRVEYKLRVQGLGKYVSLE